MDRIALDILQLRHPFPNINSLRIKLLALQRGIEDAKVRLRIDASTRAKTPASVVGSKVSVNQSRHEILLAQAPVEQEVLGEEASRNHAASIVHVACVIELAHCGVDEGIARAAISPCGEVFVVVFPFDVCVLWLEAFVHAGGWLAEPIGQGGEFYQTNGQCARTCL